VEELDAADGNLAGELPAAIASGVLFAICLGLYLMVERIDREGQSRR
jgi:hypothetical protein